MMSFSSIPVVDVSRGPRAAAEDLGRAAREVGFMYIAGSGIDPRIFEDLLAVTRRFFALPMDEKMRVWIGHSANHRGYVPEGEEVFAGGTADRKEAFDLALDLPATEGPLLGPNQWPGLPGFREAVTAYYDAVLAFGHRLFEGLALALGEEPGFFAPHLTRPPSQLRLIHYPHDATAEDRPGIGAHTDYECFTLLRPTAPGLEVQSAAAEWIDVPPLPDTFVLNIGDMLELWTNGEFVATTHRVRTVKQERYSFPLFFSVDYETKVTPMAGFQRPGAPPRAALVAGEHLFAQTAQSFTYLRDRIAAGELALPDGSVALSSFGHPGQS